jgi:hypothetical protein
LILAIAVKPTLSCEGKQKPAATGGGHREFAFKIDQRIFALAGSGSVRIAAAAFGEN